LTNRRSRERLYRGATIYHGKANKEKIGYVHLCDQKGTDAVMEIFENMISLDHENLVFCNNSEVGLRAIIGIHNTTLGPALGGTRMWPFASEEEAITDVLRLSRGMTYKAAAAGLNLGGGKAVIIADPKKDKSEELFRAFGRFVESLGGRYITAEDVGTSVEDMEYVYMETKHVTGITAALGGSGDPSPVTAFGVYHGMKAAVLEKLGKDSLKGLKIAVQGVGHVGYYLVEYIVKEGASVIVTDIDKEKVDKVVSEFGVRAVDTESIYDEDVDIFSPCALGAIVNDDTIPRLKCQIIAGGANNQLKAEHHGLELEKREILYAPDYVINAGGLINVSIELEGYNRDRALRRAGQIYDRLLEVFAIAKEENIPTSEAADRMAEKRIRRIASLKRSYIN
jgi:leucine dehydrogenase